MEIREIFDTLESDPNIDQNLQKDILEKIENIARADQLVDGLEKKIEQHRNELSEKELKYIINKCISYKSVFYRFRNGSIIDYDQLNDITKRIFELEESIRKNDFYKWKEELVAYKGSKEDKEEDRVIKNMLMVVPEERNVVDKIAVMFKRALWKFQQKSKNKNNDEEKGVIELPQTSLIDIELNEHEFKKFESSEDEVKGKTEEVDEGELEEKFGDCFEDEAEQDIKLEKHEEEVAEEVKEDIKKELEEKDLEENQEPEPEVRSRAGAQIIEEESELEDESPRRRTGNKESV